MVGVLFVLLSVLPVFSDEFEFRGVEHAFKNFVRCELTGKEAEKYMNGQSFTVAAIHLYDVKKEGDLSIVTGSADCWVKDRYVKLYAAVGVKELYDKKKVYCFVTREENFSIIATELLNYPYRNGCPWTRYWLDTD